MIGKEFIIFDKPKKITNKNMKIKIKELEKICLAILIKKGLSRRDALVVYGEYLDSELSGHKGHGFQAFVEFGAKLIDSEGRAKVLKEDDNLLYIDGKRNLGQIVCNEYVPKLIKKAKKKNIAMMGVKNMHSYLRPGTHAKLAAENDLVGFVFNYGGWPRIAPTGSIDPFFATNPIAIGIPAEEYPIVVDMATSKRALMAVRLAKKLGKKIPKGLAIDEHGNSTTNPDEALLGALLPFGDYKGSALALVVEILTKTMFDVDIHDEKKAGRGFLFIFFNPKAFIDIKKFKKNVSQMAEEIKSLRHAKGVDEIFIPGERSEKERIQNSKKDYLEIDEKIIKEIKELV